MLFSLLFTQTDQFPWRDRITTLIWHNTRYLAKETHSNQPIQYLYQIRLSSNFDIIHGLQITMVSIISSQKNKQTIKIFISSELVKKRKEKGKIKTRTNPCTAYVQCFAHGTQTEAWQKTYKSEEMNMTSAMCGIHNCNGWSYCQNI